MEEHLYQELNELGNKHWWFVSKRRIILCIIKKYLKRRAGNNILDAGCGGGLMLDALKEYGTVCGMDGSEEAIRYSRQVFDGEVKKGSLPDDIPYPPDSFDLVLALDVLEHIENDSGALLCISSILKDKGICVLTVPAFSFLWSGHDEVHGHKRRYTLKGLERKLLDENFEILKISYYNTILFLPILVSRFAGKILRKKSSDAKMPNSLVNLLLERIFSFERHILLRWNMPFGVSIIAVARKNRGKTSGIASRTPIIQPKQQDE